MPDKSKTQQQQQNNTKGNLSPFVKPDNNDKSNANSQQQQQQQQQTQQQQLLSAEQKREQLQGFLKTAGLYNNVDADAFMKALDGGDPDTVLQTMHTMMENAVQAALLGAKKMQDSGIANAMRDAESKFTQSTRNKMAIEQMHNELSFTNDEGIKDYSEKVLEGYIENHGMSPTEAIKATRDFFRRTTESLGSEFGMKRQSQDQSIGNTRFNQQMPAGETNNNDTNDEQDVDFVDVLTGGNRSFEDLNPSGGTSEGE